MSDQMSDSMVTRRGFFQRAGLVAVTVSVPTWVWGCGGTSDAAEPTSDASSGGEDTSATDTSATDTSGGLGMQGSVSTVDDAARARVTAFEAEGVLTAAQPGPWEGKAPGHVPQVTFQPGGGVELFTDHPMSPEHYITAQYVKDQDGNVLGFATHEGTDAEARARFTLPAGTTQITAYSHCNRHGDWSADPASANA